MGTAAKDKDRFPAARNLKAVHKTKLYQEITEQIQRLIERGQLKHGDQFAPERRLTDMFHKKNRVHGFPDCPLQKIKNSWQSR
jgi:hypothetical protein